MSEEKMIENLEQEMYRKTAGFTTALVISPGGQKDGLDYGPVIVEIVVLDIDGTAIAYRTSTDTFDDEWNLGSAEDAVKALIAYRE